MWSGGTEEVLSPHTTIFGRTVERREGSEPRLVLGVAEAQAFAPEEIGTLARVRGVASAVTRARQSARISEADVHYLQVKGALVTSAAIADADVRGATLVTQEPNAQKRSHAVRWPLALGSRSEKSMKMRSSRHRRPQPRCHSAVASTSAGGELKTCEVLLFGNAPGSAGD